MNYLTFFEDVEVPCLEGVTGRAKVLLAGCKFWIISLLYYHGGHVDHWWWRDIKLATIFKVRYYHKHAFLPS